MASKSKEFDFQELLEFFKSKLQTMEYKEIVRLSADLLYIRYYFMAISMKDTLTSEELDEILEYLHNEFAKQTTKEAEVLAFEMVQ